MEVPLQFMVSLRLVPNLMDTSMGLIKAGSHSRLATFELCKRQAKLKYVDKIPEPDRPLPPGKSEHANDRGTRIHLAAEKYVQGGVELIQELKHFAPELNQLKKLNEAGQVSLEGEWAFNRKWEPVAWMSHDVWLRMKLDAMVFLSMEHAVAVDYKSGKRWGNEVKHADQMHIYQLGGFIRYPKLKKIDVELWYTDQDELNSRQYRREQGLRFVSNIETRMDAMTSETEFPPKPSAFTCRWCPFKPVERGGTGHCDVGV